MGDCAFHKILSGLSQKLQEDHRLEDEVKYFHSMEDLNGKLQSIDKLERDGYFKSPQFQPRIHKNNEKSSMYRNMGNKQFERQTNVGYLAALKYYNKSICYAENESEELGIGFGNRSAVFFELGLYDDCLDNIKLAKQCGPARIIDKLIYREKLCLDREVSAKNSSSPIVTPELSYPANEAIPFIANCLEMKRNEQYGRHIITTTDLKPGDVVATEEAFCTTMHHEFQYARCEYCLSENNYNLLPCTQCVSVMFCAKCRDKAYDKFHRIECPVVDFMAKLLCKSILLTYRTVIRAITSFDSADCLITFIEETSDQDLTVFDCNYKEKSSHNFYAPVHFAEERCDPNAEFSTCLLVHLISQALLEFTELKYTFKKAKAIIALKGLIYHHINRIPSVTSAAIYFGVNLFDQYAIGLYPFRNLLNHSCVPNVVLTSLNNKMVYTVLRPIKAGEQLFDNYEYVY